MTSENRTFGRIVLVIVGLVMLAGGLGTVLVAAWPAATTFWRHNGPRALAGLGTSAPRDISATAWGIVLVVAVLVGVFAIVVLTTRGGGRTDTILKDSGATGDMGGEVRVAATAVQRAVSDALTALPQIGSLSVDVYRVRRTTALRIRVRPRRGASPRAIVSDVERVVADLDALLGVRLPVLLHVARGGGVAAQPARVR